MKILSKICYNYGQNGFRYEMKKKKKDNENNAYVEHRKK